VIQESLPGESSAGFPVFLALAMLANRWCNDEFYEYVEPFPDSGLLTKG
jgi:hypothetical protein